MKTSYKILIIVIPIALIASSAYINAFLNLVIDYDTFDDASEQHDQQIILSDPICFVVDRATSGETRSAVTMDTCISLEQFEEMGCTKPMLEHILKHSNLLDYEDSGPYYLEFAGLPKGVSQEKFDECFDSIFEKRPTLNSISDDDSNSCPEGQDYNQVLFKCVVSCDDDLVYDGNTDSCTTEFDLKYHGFCNDGFTYDPSLHTCNSDDGVLQIPLKDPPRTAPPELEPAHILTEVHCFPNQIIYNDECIYVLTQTDEFPEDMTKYFLMVDDKITNFCEIASVTSDGEHTSGKTIDRCFEISHYTISEVNEIKFQSTTHPTWINIKIEDLTRYVELGSSPTFKVIESGWGNPCTHPTLEVYHMKQEIGAEPSVDDLIYKHRIVYSCPWYEITYPPPDVLKIWDESDFPNLPICEKQGRFLIIGDSGYERIPLDDYYCGVENEN